ncbi:MAG TPA: hypothetical protein PK455_07030, partial [Caldisericia bacterium]|nr:hypothetical protein [Caldisericia bacterium]
SYDKYIKIYNFINFNKVRFKRKRSSEMGRSFTFLKQFINIRNVCESACMTDRSPFQSLDRIRSGSFIPSSLSSSREETTMKGRTHHKLASQKVRRFSYA